MPGLFIIRNLESQSVRLFEQDQLFSIVDFDL